MTVLDLLLGRPLASDEARGEQIGSLVGVPVFGLDALSSAAYGPEAALTLLIPLSVAGIAYIVPISVSIIGSPDDCVFLLSPDDPSLSRRWRVLYRRTPEPRRFRRTSRRRGVDD